jgi:NADH-quinone oxidoreductase subunit F
MTARAHRLLPDEPYPSYAAYLEAVGESAVALGRARKPEALLVEIKRSGLRGRGGGAFPTGIKWSALMQHSCPERWVVANAAEGEPGTFKDRWLLRRNPYAVLEGMLVAAHAIGARGCYVAIKRAFSTEVATLRRALDEMASAGVLGDVPVTVVEGPDEYLFGEEKALLNVIEGEGPLPREAHSPPHEVGLHARPGSPNPALVQNVQTLAHVSTIVRAGAASFRRIGTADTSGTILFTLSGDIRKPGVYEREAGIPLRKLLQKDGGGPHRGREIRAVLLGVAAAPVLSDKLDTPADFGSLHHIGSGLGSAGLIVLDDESHIPRVAQAVARFLYVESCNQCSACKSGLRLASRALDEIHDPAKATPDDLERALYGALSAPQGNRCGLPVGAAALLPALLARFKPDFEALLAGAPAGSAWLLPNIVDFDQATRKFVYDQRQPQKQPDWTYQPEPVPVAVTPSRATSGAVAVRLAPDVAQRLEELAQAAGLDLDRQVHVALREWLRDRS